VEVSDPARAVQQMPDIVEPENLAVSRVEERNVETAKIEPVPGRAARVTLGLHQRVLRTEAEFLRFDDAEERAVEAERIISRTVARLVLRDSVLRQYAQRLRGVKRHKRPAECF